MAYYELGCCNHSAEFESDLNWSSTLEPGSMSGTRTDKAKHILKAAIVVLVV
jgi:hypothetical protein